MILDECSAEVKMKMRHVWAILSVKLKNVP